ncbi:MAG: hypothetical protein JWN25_2619 [Verrucomicrobiales bacterium]|nr:hypothetical protein [Verrucomicrobiales bacterium]
MQSIRKSFLYICILALLGLHGTQAIAQSTAPLSLPSGQVSVYVDGGYNTFYDATLSNVGVGFDVSDDIYGAWCVDYYAPNSPAGQPFEGTLFNSLGSNLPSDLQASYWDLVNYVINHKQGDRNDIQAAIWYFTDGDTWDVTPAAQAMILDAQAHGEGFVPAVGQQVAVIVRPAMNIQTIIIEVPQPSNPPSRPGECDDFVTGGGWILGTPSGAKGNFGVHGGIKNGSYWGGLNYIDHGTGMHIKSTGVTGYSVVDQNTRMIAFNVTIDGAPGTALVQVTDNGEPGRNDLFSIRLSNGYNAGGDLGGSHKGGGNIQLHKPHCKNDAKGGKK